VVEERTGSLANEKADLETELARLQEKTVDLKIQNEEEIRSLQRKVEEEETQKYQSMTSVLQAKISNAQEAHSIFLQRNSDLINELTEND